MFEVSKEILENMRNALIPMKQAIPVSNHGPVYASCAGCTGACMQNCVSGCKGSCKGGCTRSCKGHSR